MPQCSAASIRAASASPAPRTPGPRFSAERAEIRSASSERQQPDGADGRAAWGDRGRRPSVERAQQASSTRGDSKAAVMSEAAVRRIWQKLDRFNSGAIQVKDIVANASFVKQECPVLLERYHMLATGGTLGYKDFRQLMLGPQVCAPAQSTAEAPMKEEDLRRLFETLANAEGFITALELVEHKELVMKTFPALIQDFERIDIDKNAKIYWDELKVFVGGTAEWLELELESVVGLHELKDQVRAFYRSIMLDRTRRQHGHDVSGVVKAPHMIFQGNPGTGKTSLGRIMARLLHRIGVISKPALLEVQRPDLVGEHVGQTGPKTQAVINDAKEGVLFVDEAYRLTNTESKNDFGKEALETLMAAMNDPPGKAPVMIFAGYTKDMAAFMRANEGLYRRIGYTFNFADYCTQDLAQIFELITSGRGFKIEPALLADDRTELAALIEENTLPRARSLMNGGLCERIFDVAKLNLDARDDAANPSVLLSKDDIRAACLRIPPPPELLESTPVPPPIPVAAPAGVALLSDGSVAPPLELECPKPSQKPDVWNIWFHIDMAEGIRRHGFSCCGALSAQVSVRLDKTEVHRTAARPSKSRSPVWQETHIVPYQGEALLEFVLMEQGRFAGSAVVALSTCSLFDGKLELRTLDKPSGQLFVKMGWQRVTPAIGEDVLRACYSSVKQCA